MKENKKILLITKHFPPEIDGVGDHSYQLASRLKNHGFFVEILNSTLNIEDNFKHYHNPLNGFRDLNALTEIIQEAEPDIILFQYVPFSYNVKGLPFWLIAFFNQIKKQNIKILFFAHETFERRRAKFKHILLEYLQKAILFRLSGLSDTVFTTNKVYATHLKKFKNKLYLTRTPSNFQDIAYHSRNKTSKEKIDIRLTYFGNRDFKKTLHIFKELYAINNKTRLSIVGKITPNHFSDLKYPDNILIKEKIKITGPLAAHQILEELSQCDAYILPEYVGSKQDGGLNTKSGTTATGFMLGKVVISTKGDMTEDIFKDMSNCVLINANQPREAAKKILSALTYSKEKIEKNALKLYHEQLSWENTIKTIIKKC